MFKMFKLKNLLLKENINVVKNVLKNSKDKNIVKPIHPTTHNLNQNLCLYIYNIYLLYLLRNLNT